MFLREPSKVADRASRVIMDTLDNAATTNPFTNNANPVDLLPQKVIQLREDLKQNGTFENEPFSPDEMDFLAKANGKRSATDEFDEDDDLGPETDVDPVDDVLMSPSIAAAKNLAEGIVNNNMHSKYSYLSHLHLY